MTKKTKLILAVAGAVVLLAIAAGTAFMRATQQSLYQPGMLATAADLEPVGGSGGRWEVASGIELVNYSRGTGPNVLVIHGGPGIPPVDPPPAFDALADSYRFHYYDQRGAGLSTRPQLDFGGSQWENIQALEGALGITQQLADIERIRRLLGDEALILVGHSYGAFLAALYAAEMPARVDRLILIAPADLIVFPPRNGGLFDNIRDALPLRELVAFDTWLDRYLDLGRIFSMTEQELIEEDAALSRFYESTGADLPNEASPPPEDIGAWHARAQYFSMGRTHDYSDALGAITAPTLIVHGDYDLQPIDIASDYAGWIANSRVTVIDEAGHFPHYTHPDELAPVVREFLAGPG